MQSEDFDKRIREAAENHHPQYNERAWTGMEKMLNKHMPVEKDRRRFIFFILLTVLLLGGGTAWLLIARPWERNTNAVAEQRTGTGNSDNKTNTNTPLNGDQPTTNAANSASGNVTGTNTSVSSPTGNGTDAVDPGMPEPHRDNGNTGNVTIGISNAPDKGKTPARPIAKGSTPGQTNLLDVSLLNPDKAKRKTTKPIIKGEEPAIVSSPVRKEDDAYSKVIPPPANTVETPAAKPPANQPVVNTTADKPADPVTNKTVGEPVATTDKKTEAAPKPEKKKNNKPANSLALTVSGGGDISSVKFKNGGRMQSVFGAGLSYSFHDKLIIRGGFYTGRKIYTAGPQDYKVGGGTSTDRLARIEADCQVYEIPLGVAYNFGKAGGKQNIFAATSLSTYLMKEENYDYVYIYPGNVVYTYPWDYKNKNQHFFSVLTLSAGYTRNFGKRFSLSAEPYMKVPLTGIGQGKVRLNNVGMMFTISTKLSRE